MRWILLIAMTLVLVGCNTPYQPAGFRGGYSNTRIDEGIYRVTFRGNARTSSQRVQDFLLYRCAELAIETGSPYFAILGQNADTTSGAFSTGGGYTGQPLRVHSFKKTTATAMIRVLAAREKGFVLSAENIIKTIGKKYNIKQK